jgi:hypothetical protein
MSWLKRFKQRLADFFGGDDDGPPPPLIKGWLVLLPPAQLLSPLGGAG